MAVLVEAISVIVRVDALHSKYPGGWEQFKSDVPNRTLCADNEIVRVGFMSPQDVESFINRLTRCGLVYLEDGQALDIAVADQLHGLAAHCLWLEFGHIDLGENPRRRIAACRLTGSTNQEVVLPLGWDYEGSLSNTFAFAPAEHVEKSLRYLRTEDGLDVYLNTLTGQEVYMGRTNES